MVDRVIEDEDVDAICACKGCESGLDDVAASIVVNLRNGCDRNS